jgi:hypothetical protein
MRKKSITQRPAAARHSPNQRGAEEAIRRGERAQSDAAEQMQGGAEPELDGRAHLDSIVRTVARRVSASQNRLTGGNTLETMARLKQDSLLNTPVAETSPAVSRAAMVDGGKKLKDALEQIDASAVNELFFSEKGRTDDYLTYAQMYELITQVSEAVQTYCDNIISPDDFTKRDISVFYEDPSRTAETDVVDEARTRCNELIEKYKLEDRIETAIVESLKKGDFFVGVFNLRQELETLLTEEGEAKAQTLFTEHHVPNTEDDDMRHLVEAADGDDGAKARLRADFAALMNETFAFNENVGKIAAQTIFDMRTAQDLPAKSARRGGRGGKDEKKALLAKSKIRGSVVKMIPPENVIKLYHGDTLFGYYFLEYSGPSLAAFSRTAASGAGTPDQTTMSRAIDQNYSLKMFGTNDAGFGPNKGKEAIIGRLIVKTLAARLGNSKFLTDHEEAAADAYTVLLRARQEGRRVTVTYVAPDQMVHFTPNGTPGYGDSVLSRVKFLAKLYIGAMTNAFMRNSIRRPERLVWYIDIGVDNDGNNAVQNFIRTIKQREVKFSNLRDITTTINHVGEFHDFYVPTYNGERPVEVETLTLGGAADVDTPFLEYLRKAIIGGTGVPAAFVGYSEEVAFARSLTMDNGRFLRRVVRHQKHYGRQATQIMRLLYRNEFLGLDEILGGARSEGEAKDGDREEVKRSGDGSAAGEEDNRETPRERIRPEYLIVRFPSPATLNMTNLADAINQASGVVEFIVESLASAEEDGTKSTLKLLVTKDLMPQIRWNHYEDMLAEAKTASGRKKAIETEPTTPAASPASGEGDDSSMES